MNPYPKSIVLVDDEKAYADFLAAMLIDLLRVPVVTFSRAQDALNAMPNLSVGIVVTDYWMPDMNGFDFVRAAGRIAPHVPTIIISGHGIILAEQDVSTLDSLRAIIAKPFSYRQLAQEILSHAPDLQGPVGAALQPAPA